MADKSIRVNLSFDSEQLQVINNIKGMGTKAAEKCKNIILSWLSEKGYFMTYIKKEVCGTCGNETLCFRVFEGKNPKYLCPECYKKYPDLNKRFKDQVEPQFKELK